MLVTAKYPPINNTINEIGIINMIETSLIVFLLKLTFILLFYHNIVILAMHKTADFCIQSRRKKQY